MDGLKESFLDRVGLDAIDAMARMPRRPRLATGGIAYHVLNRRVGGCRCSKSPETIPPLKKFSAKPTSEPTYGLRHIV